MTPGLPAEPVIPEFTEEVNNKTVVAGREAVLTCHVTHIGSYKVETCLVSFAIKLGSLLGNLICC